MLHHDNHHVILGRGGERSWIAMAVVFLLAAWLVPAVSEAAGEEALQVGPIIFELPEDINDPGLLEQVKALKPQIALKRGDCYSPDKIQEIIRSLFRHNIFSQIQVYGEQSGNEIALRFHVVPKTEIDEIVFKGNRKLDDADLLRAIRVRAGDRVFPEDLGREVGRLRKTYRNNGFPFAIVRIEQLPTQISNRIVLRISIIEGRAIEIKSIEFEGELSFSPRMLKRKFPVRVGDRLDIDEIYMGISKLRQHYRAGGFEEARIGLLDADEDEWERSLLFKGGCLRIRIHSGRRIALRFSGNRYYSPNELKAVLNLEEQEVISYSFATLEKLKKDLKDFYQRQGYLHVRIRARTKLIGGRLKLIIVSIREGKRVKLTDINFPGAKAFDEDELGDEMFAYIRDRLASEDEDSLKPPDPGVMDRGVYRVEERARRYPSWEDPPYARPEALDSDEVYIPEIFEEAARALKQFYRENGYLSCRVGQAGLHFNETGQRLKLSYLVDEGVQTFIRKIQVAGTRNKTDRSILELAEMKLEEPLNDLAFEDISRRIQDSYAQDGRIYSKVDISYTLSPDQRRADVIVAISEGPQVRVGHIIPIGLKKTKRKTVLQELTFEENDVYRPSDMDDSQRWLQRLGIFQAVTLKPLNPEKEEEKKDVLVTTIERKPGRFELSGGLATDEGVRGGLSFVYRNLMGAALEFHTKAKVNHRVPVLLDEQFADLYDKLPFVDALEREVTVGTYYPSILGSHIGIRNDVMHTRRQERAYGLDKNSLIIGFDTQLVRYVTLAQVNEFSYLDSKSTTLKPLRDDELIPSFGQIYEYSPKLHSIFDYRDSMFNPTLGVVITGLAEYFETIAGDLNVDLFRASGSVAGYVPIPITRRTTVLKLTLKSGAIAHVSPEETPVDKRFKLGGRTSLRGFGEEAVYPADLTREQIEKIREENLPSSGGDMFLLMKLDLRHSVYKNYYFGLFADSGSLWLDPEHVDLRLDHYKNSAGGGIHYRTPVGDISLEIGWNLNRKKELFEDHWRLHFSINLF